MTLTLIITKFSIKNQLYDGIAPTAKHILTKKLINALFLKKKLLHGIKNILSIM